MYWLDFCFLVGLAPSFPGQIEGAQARNSSKSLELAWQKKKAPPKNSRERP